MQKNFETVKTVFYRLVISNPNNVEYVIIKFNIANGYKDGRCYIPNAIKEFKKDFNKWLDSIDIRMVGSLIDYINSIDKGLLPEWLSKKEFFIDYNDSGMLDLTKNYKVVSYKECY